MNTFTTTTTSVVNQDDVKAIMDAFKVTHGRETALSVDDVTALLELAPQDEPMTMEDWIEAVLEAEPTSDEDTADLEAEKEAVKRSSLIANVIGAPSVKPEDTKGKSVAIVDAEATRIGSLLANNKDLVADIQELIKVKDATKRLPVAIAWHIGQTLTKEAILALPIPGSTKKSLEDMGSQYRNYKPDLGKVGEPSFYAQLALSFPDYVSIIKTIGYIDAAKDVDNADTKPFRAMSTSERATEKTMWVGRRSTFVGSIKNGIKLLWKFYEVADKLTNMQAEFRTEKHDGRLQIMRKTALIKVVDVVKHEAKYFTMGAFNAVDIDAVAKTEDHFANFEAVRANNRDGESPVNIIIDNAVKFESAMASLAAYSDDDTFKGSLYQGLMKEDNEDFRSSVFTSATIINQLLSSPAIKALYLRDQKRAAERQAKIDADLDARTKHVDPATGIDKRTGKLAHNLLGNAKRVA